MTSIATVADRHRQRRDRAPRGLHVGVRVGEQLAGRVPLVPLHREGEVLPGDRAAVVRLHAVLHDAGAEPAGDDADRAEQGHADEQPEDRPEDRGGDLAVLERGQHDVLGGPAEHPRVGDGQRAEEDTAERGEGEDPGLAADGHGEYGEPVTQGGGSGGHQVDLMPSRPTDFPSGPPLGVGPCSVDDPWPASSGQQLVTPPSRTGPDAPTLCGDWTVRDLLAHLLVRERSPLGAAGIQVASLAGADRPGDGEGVRAGLPGPGRGGPPGAHAAGAAAGRRRGEHAGVLRAPRGHPPRPAGLGAAEL